MSTNILHNIFAKPKAKSQEKTSTSTNDKIIVKIDYREKNSLVASELVSLGIEIEFLELKVGDYIVNNVAIERKTITDFMGSMINQRLVRQLEELQQYENKLLIIEGYEERELYSEESHKVNGGIHPNAIRGFLLTILLRYKIPIIFSKNYEDTAKFIATLARKRASESGIRATKKALTPKEQIQFILEGFPGVGPKTAKKLIEKFKSLKGIFNASEEELKSILGKKTEIFKGLIDKEF